MMELRGSAGPGGELVVLALGAHSDDVEIGCGGTILRLLRERQDVVVHWVVFSAEGPRAEEARRSAARFLEGARRSAVQVHQFRDGFLPYEGAAVKEAFEEMKGLSPDLILTHHGADRHQDHRLVCELTWNTFRRHTILEYEIPKYDGDLGRPNVFVPLGEEVVERKVDLLMEGFASQRSKRWFTPETFRGLMRLRGIEAPEDAAYAEAFHARKLAFRP